MDGLGTAFDRKSRVSMVRTYAIDSIRRARDFIYKLGRTIKSVAVKAVLSSHSWVPTIVCLSGMSFIIQLQTDNRIHLQKS